MPRIKASLTHLLLSATVVSLAMLIVYLIWYPPPYAYTNNILLIIQILVAVDVVLGPVLTFVVFNTKKPKRELKRDLGIIATVQLCALAYGLFTLYIQRPVYTVYAMDRFEVLGDYDVVDKGAPDSIGDKPIRGPQYVYLRPPADSTERSKLLDLLVDEQIEMVALTDRYLPVDPHARTIAKNEIFVDDIAKAGANIERGDEIDRLRKYAASNPEGVMYHVLQGRQRSIVVAVDRQSGEFRESFKLDPWEAATAAAKRRAGAAEGTATLSQ